jgi:TorA maturation chaperone TorD
MELETIKKRREIYAFISRLFLEAPPEELADDMVNGSFFTQFKSFVLNDEMKEGIKTAKQWVKNHSSVSQVQECLKDEFESLFVDPTQAVVTLYETKYVKGKTGEVLLRVKEAYLKAGLEKSEKCVETEDHIALELDFMKYLCDKEIENFENEDFLKFFNLQREFLKELLKWIPFVCKEIFVSEKASFYKGISKVATGFLNYERSLLENGG